MINFISGHCVLLGTKKVEKFNENSVWKKMLSFIIYRCIKIYPFRHTIVIKNKIESRFAIDCFLFIFVQKKMKNHHHVSIVIFHSKIPRIEQGK